MTTQQTDRSTSRTTVPTGEPSIDLTEVRARVDAALHAFLDGATGELTRVGPELGDVAVAVRGFLDGGKRIRPLFCYAGWLAAGRGRVPEDVVVRAAASLELVQVAALVHDDIIDASASRRGRPTVHVAFADRHRDAGWCGPADDFGVAAGILIGDLGLIWADRMLAEAGLNPADLATARTVFDAMRAEVIAGQYLDVRTTVDPAHAEDGVEVALRVARHKSASYTVAQPLRMGGVLADADPTTLAAYADYGLNLGEAFQLRDDVLGVFGDPVRTGKPAGDDITEGKRTVLLATTELLATEAADRALLARVGQEPLSPADISAVAELMRTAGALDRVEAMIDERTAAALVALDRVALDADGREALRALAAAATARTT